MAYLGALVGLLFAWELGQGFAWPALFFFVIALVFSLTNLRSATSQLEVLPSGLAFYRRFVAPLHIEFRQIVTVAEEGRMTKGISVIYYPLDENGLIDLDDPRSLFLPGMDRQDQLLEIVQQEIVE